MIKATPKPLEEIIDFVKDYNKILVAGCDGCVTVCEAGGMKEAKVLGSALRLYYTQAGKDHEVVETTITRQCDKEYLDQLAKHMGQYDAVLSTGCGAGVQFLAERYDDKIVLPALNTLFIGVAEGPGAWSQRCTACADCLLDQTGGICPMTICAKNLLNGPCGGTNHGKCEVDGQKDCAWTLIYRRLEKLGRLDLLKKVQPPKDYSVATKPGRFTHEAFQQAEQQE